MPHHDDCSPQGDELRKKEANRSLDCNPHRENPLLDRRADDPWKHRSQGMRCKTCMWFSPKKTDSGDPVYHHIGRCRRHAPTMSGYPVVFPTDWCGDHKIDENKI